MPIEWEEFPLETEVQLQSSDTWWLFSHLRFRIFQYSSFNQMSLNVAQPGSVWAWNCSPLSKLRAFTSRVTWMPACTRRHYISWDWCVCLCACVWYELRILAGRYLSLNRKWPPTFKSSHKIKQCFIYARYLCLLTALPFWIHLHHKFLQWNLNCGCSAILCDLNVLFINNSQNKPLLYMYWVCVPLFFLSFVEIPCVFSFGVGVGLRNSICIKKNFEVTYAFS